MKNWIQFTNIKNDIYCYETNRFIKLDKPIHQPGLGSFANISFDGRYSLDTIINLCFEYMNKNKRDNFSGFIIHQGGWLIENKIYQYINK